MSLICEKLFNAHGCPCLFFTHTFDLGTRYIGSVQMWRSKKHHVPVPQENWIISPRLLTVARFSSDRDLHVIFLKNEPKSFILYACLPQCMHYWCLKKNWLTSHWWILDRIVYIRLIDFYSYRGRYQCRIGHYFVCIVYTRWENKCSLNCQIKWVSIGRIACEILMWKYLDYDSQHSRDCVEGKQLLSRQIKIKIKAAITSWPE